MIDGINPFKVQTNSPEAEKCSVCLMAFGRDVATLITSVCRHTFHSDCLKNSLIAQKQFANRTTCPLCRTDLSSLAKVLVSSATPGQGGHGQGRPDSLPQRDINQNALVYADRQREHERERARERYQHDPAYAQYQRSRQSTYQAAHYQRDSVYAERQRARKRERQRARYRNDPAYAERQRERQREYRQRQRERYQNDPVYAERQRERQREYRQRQRERYHNDPAYAEHMREYQRERQRARRETNQRVNQLQSVETVNPIATRVLNTNQTNESTN
ncbi:E3 ubiquitin protein ligase [Thalassotalea sp. G20_0]|nr:E3 ubiquitin protein ligase [Thalassotalea sp. G20_0]